MMLAACVLTAMMLFAAACRSAEPAAANAADSDARPAPARRSDRAQPTAAAGPLTPPPGIPAAELLPHEGDALVTARLSLEQVIERIGRPGFLDDAAEQAGREPDAEPPVAAQHAYLTARQYWREGMNFEAMRELEKALRLDPNAPEIHRMLAHTNAVRAPFHLQRALVLDPKDAAGAFDLGRAYFEREQWTDAVAVLAYARSLKPERDAQSEDIVRQLLTSYYLGGALMQLGYDAAGVDELVKFLDTPVRLTMATPTAYQLAMAKRRSGLIWQAIGDAQSRLDQPALALSAYRRAGDESVPDARVLLARVAYTLLCLDQTQAATDVVLNYLDAHEPDRNSSALIKYLVDHGGDRRAIATRLDAIYVEQGRPAHVALLIAELRGPNDGRAFLLEHLAAKPGDEVVLRELIERGLSGDGQGDSSLLARLMRLVAAAITAEPARGEAISRPLLDAIPSIAPVQQAFKQDAALAADPAARFILARFQLRDGDKQAAQQQLIEVVEQAPQLTAARIELAALYLRDQQYEQAERVLRPIQAQDDPQVIRLQAQVLERTDNVPGAIALLDDAIGRIDDDVDLIVEKARLQLVGGDAPSAERTLLDALQTRPEAEAIYEQLFVLYDANAVPDASKQWVRLMDRMLYAIPASRLARLKKAEWDIVRRNYGQAESVLKELLEENPRDYQALNNLLDVLAVTGRKNEADTLIDARIDQFPHDTQLLYVALKHYTDRSEDIAKANVYLERLLLQQPASLSRDIQLARLYLATERGDEAADLLEQAVARGEESDMLIGAIAEIVAKTPDDEKMDERFAHYVARLPKHEADLMFWWAINHERRGNFERFEAIMLDLLEKHPDHANANNSLGYLWTVRHVNLERARDMIQRAVDAQPAEAAFLDSLGWVYYKLGDFDQAVQWLKRADAADGDDDPIILDHVGDALYRAGDTDQAKRYWQHAQSQLDSGSQSTDPERMSLPDRLQRKLEAVKADQQAPVAESPGHQPPARDETDP
jgi:tetratricopeptide (TPR) repeat protein